MADIITPERMPRDLRNRVRKTEVVQIDGVPTYVETRLCRVMENTKSKRRYVMVARKATSDYLRYLRKDGKLGKQGFWIGARSRDENYKYVGGIVVRVATEPVKSSLRSRWPGLLILFLLQTITAVGLYSWLRP